MYGTGKGEIIMEQNLTSCYDPKTAPKLELAIFYHELKEGEYGRMPDRCFWNRVEITLDGETYFVEDALRKEVKTLEEALKITLITLPTVVKRTILSHEKNKVKL